MTEIIQSIVSRKRYKIALPFVLLCILLLFALPNQSIPLFAQLQWQQPDDVAALGIITGTVTDEEGNPLAGIRVSAYAAVPKSYFELHNDALSDSDGRFQISGLESGLYGIRFHDPNSIYLTQVHGRNDSRLTVDKAIPISGNQIDNVNVSLSKGGHISGKIEIELQRDTHTASDSIRLRVYENESGARVRSETVSLVDNETYHIFALPAGQYRICASISVDTEFGAKGINGCYGNTTGNAGDAAPISVAADETTENIDLKLGNSNQYGFISGAVTDSDGRPLEGIAVDVRETYYSVSGAITNSAGEYEISYLSPGQYGIFFDDPEKIYLSETYTGAQGNGVLDVQSGELYEDRNATLTVGGQITGTIYTSGIRNNTHGITVLANWTEHSSLDQTTGVYQIKGLPTGSYEVKAKASEWDEYSYWTSTEFVYETPVDVIAGQTTENIDISVSYPPISSTFSSVLAGQVTSEGEPLEGIRVNLHSTTRGYLNRSYPEPVYYTETDENGNYLIEGLHATVRRLSFVDLSGLYVTLFNDNKYEHATADDITIDEDERIVINAELQKKGSISGQIRDVDGDGIDGDSIDGDSALIIELTINVHGFSLAGEHLPHMWLHPDTSGAYFLDDLVPGDYVISILRPQQLYNESQDERLLQRVFATVSPGETTIVQDAIIGTGVPLSLEIVTEPQTNESIYFPFGTY